MDLPFGGAPQSYTCRLCSMKCRSSGGLSRHYNSRHRQFTPASEGEDEHQHSTDSHPIINAQPCDAEGNYLPPYSLPPPLASLNGQAPNSWAPFESPTDFASAHFHFVEAQGSAGEINTALDLWAAQVLKYSEDIPWKNATQLYETIDSIQHGDAPWKVQKIRYQGPRPAGTPAKWMTETYELCSRDIRTVLHNQLATADFKDQFNYTPYRQFNAKGKRDMIAEDENNHGTMFVPVVGGSDKTTVSVGTGHQEYHPVYSSPGNLTGIARRAHSNGVLPAAFLPIPKTTKRQRKTVAYQKFVRQMYHACLARIFEPLKAGMTTPEVVRCPDGHFRRVIYGLCPYIADYPEQVWLSCIFQGWCPKCDAPPNNLDATGAHMRSHGKTDFLITCFDPGTLWDDFGIRSDVMPFTHNFPRAEIYELLSPDLLHQIIKATFKDHLVEWVMQYLHETHGEARALEIIADIDHRISAAPSFPGLRRFPDGRDFTQWTGDDSKALMKVYLAAIAGHVPFRDAQVHLCLHGLLLSISFERKIVPATVERVYDLSGEMSQWGSQREAQDIELTLSSPFTPSTRLQKPPPVSASSKRRREASPPPTLEKINFSENDKIDWTSRGNVAHTKGRAAGGVAVSIAAQEGSRSIDFVPTSMQNNQYNSVWDIYSGTFVGLSDRLTRAEFISALFDKLVSDREVIKIIQEHHDRIPEAPDIPFAVRVMLEYAEVKACRVWMPTRRGPNSQRQNAVRLYMPPPSFEDKIIKEWKDLLTSPSFTFLVDCRGRATPFKPTRVGRARPMECTECFGLDHYKDECPIVTSPDYCAVHLNQAELDSVTVGTTLGTIRDRDEMDSDGFKMVSHRNLKGRPRFGPGGNKRPWAGRPRRAL
ncbi:C2H2-type domain-containing protein [Mycena venus]|uniref:C2H2-type domain-containing protein n=1 Tax=Mycena venus TaxID=2733690 RepID=A0A8H6Y775_9AGAR|nr:C2H2-type domain-containing protein [Mycena venus]